MSKGFRWTVAVLFGLLVLSCVAPQIVTIAYMVVVGWFGYLTRVLPSVRVSWPGVATAITCLLVIALLGHRFAAWLWSSVPADGSASASPSVPWRMRWTMAILAVVVLMFVAGIGATGVAHQAAWLARSGQPMFEYRTRETANRVKCASNLKQIGLALLLYSQDNGGRLPDSMFELLEHVDITPELFCCPSALEDKAPGATTQEWIEHLRKGRHNSYVYHGRGLTLPQPDDVPIACEPLGNHDGDGMNILFGDGHVEFLIPSAAEQALRKLPTTRPVQPTTAGGV